MNHVLRSIDVGYRRVKFTTTNDLGLKANCQSFSSIVVEETSHNLITHASGKKRDTIPVIVNNKRYEVGHDIELCLKSSCTTPRHSDYISTDDYLALNYGALAYMQESQINLLVVGLPVQYLGKKKAKLEKLLTGTHHINEAMKVQVDEVLVVAQPLGGFLNYWYSSGQFSVDKQDSTLIIDPGYFTLDWVVAKGTAMAEELSGSYSGGVSEAHSIIAKAVQDETGYDMIDHLRIDNGLRTGRMKLAGRTFDLSKHIPKADRTIAQHIGEMKNKIGDGHNIDNIVLVGGGAYLYQPIVKQYYPDHNVVTMAEPDYANVKGYQVYGESIRQARAKGRVA
jgi:plasmid segregation protein ParM